MAHTQQRNQHSDHRSTGLDKIHAAYNFVPLSEIVFIPDWADQVSHDLPMRDAYSGTLNLSIQSHGPILPGAKKGSWIEHFQLPDGHLAIPGSTLRGMIRSVMEIAAFGKMRLVDDRRLGVRDLHAAFYQKALTEEVSKPKHYKPKVKTGWLRYHENEWSLTPCQHARIEQSMIRNALKIDTKSWVNTEKNKDRPTAEMKYQKWLLARKTLKTRFTPGTEDYQHHKNSGNHLYYQPVRELGSTGKKDGYLIFTGQPGPASHKDERSGKWRSGKHMEFIFHTDNTSIIKVDPKVIRDFQHIYDSEEDQKQKKQGHYHYLKTLDFDGKGIPVFYLEKNGQVASIGLSQMFKLPYDNSIGDLIDQRDPRHRANNEFDLAELIFGTVDDVDGKGSLKGRVSFAHARSQHPAENYATNERTTILNGPKPSYYPNYILQQQQDGKLQSNQYKTYMNDADNNAPQIRGWKRYPVRQTVDIPRPEAGQGESVQSKLKPVTETVKYTGKLRFHNLNKEELGAVLWAMTWGNDHNLRHALGMGKPFGLGQISIHVDWDASTVIANQPDDVVPELTSVLNAFTDMMSQQISNWQATDQIKQLLAMADPAQAEGKNLKHMSLNGGGRNNEFVLAKGGQRHDKLVLEKYAVSGDEPKQAVAEEQEWLDGTVEALKQKNRSTTREAMLGKGLSSAWLQIEADDLKAKVLSLIQTFWKNHDSWEGPHVGRSRIAAYRMYTENSDPN